jgi:hypothetical protein
MENPKFLQNFRPKNNMLKDTFKQIFLFHSYHFNSGLVFKKTILLLKIILCISNEKISRTYVKKASEVCE